MEGYFARRVRLRAAASAGITLCKKPFDAEALAAQGGLDPVSDFYGLTETI
jgi:hypothetical protein